MIEKRKFDHVQEELFSSLIFKAIFEFGLPLLREEEMQPNLVSILLGFIRCVDIPTHPISKIVAYWRHSNKQKLCAIFWMLSRGFCLNYV